MTTVNNAQKRAREQYGLNPNTQAIMARQYKLLRVFENHGEPLYLKHWALLCAENGAYIPRNGIVPGALKQWGCENGNNLVKLGLAKRHVRKVSLPKRGLSACYIAEHVKYELTAAGRNWLRSYEESMADTI